MKGVKTNGIYRTCFVGLLLAVFHVLELMVVGKSIKTLILCRKKVDAEVTSVTEEVHEHKDSKNGIIGILSGAEYLNYDFLCYWRRIK